MTLLPMKDGSNPDLGMSTPDPVIAAMMSMPAPFPQADAPFVWGQGGSRKTPEQLALERQIAASMMQSDYSPVASPWQGLGRVADNWLGAVDARANDKETAAAKASSDAQIASTLGPGNQDIAALLTSGNKSAMGLADNLYAARTPKQAAPHFWESNDGSQWTIGSDGKAQLVYKDPTPKISWIQADNGDGTKTLIPMGPTGPLSAQMGGDPASGGAAARMPPASPAAMPRGSPLQGAANSKVVGGKQYWNINGDWYDNPEGR